MKANLKSWLWVPTLYFCEGLPYVMVMTVSTILYKRLGVSNADITFWTAWLYLPWVIKPIWSPIVDLIGTKRRWIIVMQALLGLAFAAVAFSIPTTHFFSLSLAAFWLVAFLSATQDIAADGFYIIALSERNQSFFVGIRTLFYRFALIAGQGGLVVLAGLMEMNMAVGEAWTICFAGLSIFMVLMALYHFWRLPHAEADRSAEGSLRSVLTGFIPTFISFFRKPHIWIALLFMLLYRFPEAMLIKLISPFLLDSVDNGGLGLSTGDVGLIYGTVGAIGLMLGGVIGGVVISRGGLRRWLMPMAWSMSLTCLTFVYLAYVPNHSLLTVYACVLIEQFGYGFGGTAYMLYLIYFSKGDNATAHYAIATGIMAAGMMIPGLFAGSLQELMGYGPFFLLTVSACITTIVVASLIRVPGSYGTNS